MLGRTVPRGSLHWPASHLLAHSIDALPQPLYGHLRPLLTVGARMWQDVIILLARWKAIKEDSQQKVTERFCWLLIMVAVADTVWKPHKVGSLPSVDCKRQCLA